MSPPKVLALVLAGGNGTRLHPLTAEDAKPALHFAAGHRIVDFVLSNLVNSGISSIYVLAQYKPRSLVEHIRTAWAPWQDAEGVIEVVLPAADRETGAFKGTSDAVYQNLHLIQRHRPDLVAIFAADHVYRMDVRQMARFHQETDAEISIAAVPVPIEEATQFGIIAAARDGRVEEFQEKPLRAAPMPADPSRAYASMGNYLFNARVLTTLLEEANQRADTDFGRHILPRLAGRRRVFAYDFASNTIPGLQPYEERGYWRDVGTLAAYQAAQRDVLDPRPRFSLENPEWPIRGAGCCERNH
ncbi:MAG: NTP transferase domain-containing protein [Burkholderiaceae bacterium]|nr:NTP transferase domain-containing protein [Burkholderiaceae bacterium]